MYSENAQETYGEMFGREAFNAYGEDCGWKTFDGRDMPEWKDVGEEVRQHWIIAAQKVRDLHCDCKKVPITHGNNFEAAIAALKEGKRVSRDGWNGRGMWLELQRPDKNSKMRRPYIYISIVTGELVPWVASHGDILADDWLIVE